MDDLIPSNLDSGAINPAYDPALQPRDRDHAASQAQIAKVAQTLTPEPLLIDFKQLDKGTSILDTDDTGDESGNGHVLALRKERETLSAQWQAYQKRLGKVASSSVSLVHNLQGCARWSWCVSAPRLWAALRLGAKPIYRLCCKYHRN